MSLPLFINAKTLRSAKKLHDKNRIKSAQQRFVSARGLAYASLLLASPGLTGCGKSWRDIPDNFGASDGSTAANNEEEQAQLSGGSQNAPGVADITGASGGSTAANDEEEQNKICKDECPDGSICLAGACALAECATASAVISTGAHPQGIVLGDLNGDGHGDLATANTNDSTVSIRLGCGNGSFLSTSELATTEGPHSILLFDLNEDDHLDLGLLNSTAVSVLLGQGDGSFEERSEFEVDTGADDFVVGEFNGDGHQDIAVVNQLLDVVSVLLGRGDGTLEEKVDYPVGSQPGNLEVADLNSDGHMDLLTLHTGYPAQQATLPGILAILWGSAEGDFTVGVPKQALPNLTATTLGDFNDDGHWDLGVADGGGRGWHPQLLLLPGSDNDSWSSSGLILADPPVSPITLATQDLNQDGKDDLLALYDRTIIALLQEPDSMSSPLSSQVQGGESMAVGHVNGDDAPDVAIASTSNNQVQVLLGNGDGSFGRQDASPRQ